MQRLELIYKKAYAETTSKDMLVVTFLRFTFHPTQKGENIFI